MINPTPLTPGKEKKVCTKATSLIFLSVIVCPGEKGSDHTLCHERRHNSNTCTITKIRKPGVRGRKGVTKEITKHKTPS